MIQIGVYGLGKISRRVIQGILFASNANLYALCSSSLDKAQMYQKEYGAEEIYTKYEDMLSDENVDLIYICTPNYLHAQHIKQALNYHKHVLCEKPMCITSAELDSCFDLANQQKCFLMEAHKTVFTPLNRKIHGLIQAGTIGTIQSIDAQYASRIDKEISSWHYDTAGAGCMFDIGVYPICYANYMANSSIVRSVRFKDEALIEYENGCIAHIATSWKVNMENTAYIYGTKGMIVCKNFWKNTEAYINNKKIEVPMRSDFTGEIEHACGCIEKGWIESPVMSRMSSLEILRVIENNATQN